MTTSRPNRLLVNALTGAILLIAAVALIIAGTVIIVRNPEVAP